MDELFRFSVVRPADKSQPRTLDLFQYPRPRPQENNEVGLAVLPFVSRLQQIATQAGANDYWALLEADCRTYLINSQSYDGGGYNCLPSVLFSDPDYGAALFQSLLSFVTQLQALTGDQLLPGHWPGGAAYNNKKPWPDDAAAVALAYYKQPNTLNRGNTKNDFPTQLGNLQLDLSSIFLALLIVRTDGPANLNAWVLTLNASFWVSTGFFMDKPSLRELGNVICAVNLLLSDPATLNTADEVSAILNQTLILPPAIFTKLSKPIHAIGYREFHMVKQHIRGYTLGEIATIENILMGETRKHSTVHSLSNETDTFNQTVTTDTQSKELSTSDHVDIKNETQNQVKEDTKVDGGVHAQVSGGASFKLQTDLTASYSKSSDSTQKFASDVSKDITSKVASAITTQVTQSQTTKIIESWQETDHHNFENKSQENISGIYQWVEKIYLAQTFNIGRHLIFDLTVPEPGAALLAMATVPPPNQTPPVQPDPLGAFHTIGSGLKVLDIPLKPSDLVNGTDVSPATIWIAKYQVTGIEAPPPLTKTFALAFAMQPSGENNILQNDTIHIDDGYYADTANVRAAWQQRDEDGDSVIDIQVGAADANFGRAIANNSQQVSGDSYSASKLDIPMKKEQSQIPVSCKSIYIDTAAVNIEVQCKLVNLDTWVQQAYQKIVAAWQKLQADYEGQVAALQFKQGQVGPIGSSDPEQNRLTERTELKRSCIALLDNDNSTVRGVGANVGVSNWPQPANAGDLVLPEPIIPGVAETLGARVRWFEQAFEWENMAYINYPYFWGRRSQWLQGLDLTLQYPDPLFMNFLKAGYARVVIPVRLGFENEVHCFLHNGRPWLGGELPVIGDMTQNPLYLDIAEEIKANTGGGETGDLDIPVGDPWEIKLPTALLKLRKNSAAQDPLPSWIRIDEQLKTNNADFPSDPPTGPWSWQEENPPKAIPYTTS